ncbi:MAG TPA: hypothetical protein VMB23_00185 [Spirochaetia bacterium]|nr:hypothetical protein [Spirochaetia bacterium]
MTEFEIRFRDEGHLRAHAAHFAVPLDTALGWVKDQLADRPHQGWAHFDFAAPRVTGVSGLKRIRPWTTGDFWAPRKGRTIVSHLVVGEKSPTRWLCVWGFWETERSFVLHTLYPGRTAPREIHDPEIDPEEMAAAIHFWSRHAIVVAPGEWEK